MASTTFVTGTTITSDWANDVDEAVYQANLGIPGATARTLLTKVADFVNVEDFGAVGNGIADDSVAINKALAAAKRVSFTAGATYLVSIPIICDHDIEIEGNGATITSSVANGYLNFYGSISATIPVTAAIAAGEKVVTATNSFAVGDLIVIRDNTDYSFSAHRFYYKRGEMHEVQAATGANFNIPFAIWAYNSITNLSVAKITPIKVVARNLIITNTVASDYVFNVSFGKNSIFENIAVTGGVNRAFVLDKCYGSVVKSSRCIHRAPTTPGLNYGIALAASHYTTVTDCVIHGTRHATGLGGGNSSGDVPAAYNTFDRCVFTNDPASGLYCTDIHGDAYETTYKNSTIYGAICLGGENCYYLNNSIKLNQDLPAVQIQEMVGGEVVLDRCLVDTIGMPDVSVYNNVMGATSSLTTANIGFDINFTISNCSFSIKPNIVVLMSVFLNNLNATWNVDMWNNTFRNDCSGLTKLITYTNSSGKVPRWIRIRDFHTHYTMNLALLEMFSVGSGSAAGCRLSLPASNKTTTVTSVAANYSASAAMTYGFNYGSVVPRVRAAIQNSAVKGPGYQFAVVESPTATGCTVTVTTGSSTVPIDVVYGFNVDVQAELNEYII